MTAGGDKPTEIEAATAEVEFVPGATGKLEDMKP
jgi:hypothetical protein